MRSYRICKDVLNTEVKFRLKFTFYQDSGLTTPANQIYRNYTFTSNTSSYIVPASNVSGTYTLPSPSTFFTLLTGETCLEFDFQLCPDDTTEQPNEYFKIEIVNYVATDNNNYVANVENTPSSYHYDTINYAILDNDDRFVASFSSGSYNFTEVLNTNQQSYLNTININVTEGSSIPTGYLSVRIKDLNTIPIGYTAAVEGIDFDVDITNPYSYTDPSVISIPVTIYATNTDQTNKYFELELFDLYDTDYGVNNAAAIFIQNTAPVTVLLYFDKSSMSTAKKETYTEDNFETFKSFTVTRDNPTPAFSQFKLKFDFYSDNTYTNSSLSKREYILNDGTTNYTITEGTTSVTIATTFQINNPNSSKTFTIKDSMDVIYELNDFFTISIVNTNSSNNTLYPTSTISTDNPGQFKYRDIQYEITETDPINVYLYFSKSPGTPQEETVSETNYTNVNIEVYRTDATGSTNGFVRINTTEPDYQTGRFSNRKYDFVINSATYTINEGGSQVDVPFNMGIGTNHNTININVPSDIVPEFDDYLTFQFVAYNTTGSNSYNTYVYNTNTITGIYSDLNYHVTEDDIVNYNYYYSSPSNNLTDSESNLVTTPRTLTIVKSDTTYSGTVMFNVTSYNSTFTSATAPNREYIIGYNNNTFLFNNTSNSYSLLISFNAGESSKTIDIYCIDNLTVDPIDYLQFTLNTPTSSVPFYVANVLATDNPGANQYNQIRETVIESDSTATYRVFGYGASFDTTPDISNIATGAYAAYYSDTTTQAGTVYTYDYNNTTYTYSNERPIRSNSGLVENYGNCVSLTSDGNLLAVGSQDNNRVYLYKKVSTAWQLITIMSVTDVTTTTYGSYVKFSPDGTMLAISDITYDLGANTNVGRVYVYRRDGSNFVWNLEQTIDTPNTAFLNFGFCTQFNQNNDRLLISFINCDTIYMYRYNGSIWTFGNSGGFVGSITGPFGNSFGRAFVANSNFTKVVISTPAYTANQGIVSVFTLNATNGFSGQSNLTITSPTALKAFFGYNVSISSDGSRLSASYSTDLADANPKTAIIYRYDSGTNSYVLEQNLMNLVTNPTSTYFGGSRPTFLNIRRYGVKMNLDGDIFLACAEAVSNNSDNQGVIYAFHRTGTTWSLVTTIKTNYP